jgi:outer membrane immunogenic protein
MNRSSFTLKALTAALILASTTGMVFAKGYKGDYKGEACPPPQMLKSGWYIGGQVGYDSYRVRNSISNALVALNPVFAANGWVGGLNLGYGMMMTDMFYLGGELFANWSNANNSLSMVDNDGDNLTAGFDANSSYGLALLPGVKMTDSTLTYVRLGWNWANLKSSVSGVDGATGTTFNGSKSNTSNGFVLGVGMETLLVDNWSLRGEFNHTWYSNYSANNITVAPSDNQYMLGLLYHFG